MQICSPWTSPGKLSVTLVGALALAAAAGGISRPATCNTVKHGLPGEGAENWVAEFLVCFEAGLSVAMYSTSFLTYVSGTSS